MAQTPRSVVLPETRAIALLGCFDLLATLFLLATRRAHEANPLMASVLVRYGAAGFAVAKALLIGAPLAIAELSRAKSPLFVPRALRIGLIAYVLLLLLAYRQPLLMLLHRSD